MLNFKTSSEKDTVNGNLVYVLEDYAFNFLPIPKSGVTSLAIDTLQLTVANDGQIVEVSGYSPYQSWKQQSISPPNYVKGGLFVDLNNMIPGVSEALTKYGEWEFFVNPNNGWICVGEVDSSLNETIAIEFASNSIAVLQGSLLKAIWLHPENLPDLVSLTSSSSKWSNLLKMMTIGFSLILLGTAIANNLFASIKIK